MSQGFPSFAPEGVEVGGLDLVGALELLHHQEGIGKDVEVFDTQHLGQTQAQEQGLVFCDVVGGFPQIAEVLAPKIPFGVVNNGSGSCGTGVAPGGAVHIKLPGAVIFFFLKKFGGFLKEPG